MFDFFVDIIFDGNLIIASAVAMFAGLVSFVSPCVIPLVPGYLSYAAGMTEVRSRGRAALGSLLFVLGFSTLFIAYGALFGSLGSLISNNSKLFSIVLGSLTILIGLIFLFNQKFYRSFKPVWKSELDLQALQYWVSYLVLDGHHVLDQHLLQYRYSHFKSPVLLAVQS